MPPRCVPSFIIFTPSFSIFRQRQPPRQRCRHAAHIFIMPRQTKTDCCRHFHQLPPAASCTHRPPSASHIFIACHVIIFITHHARYCRRADAVHAAAAVAAVATPFKKDIIYILYIYIYAILHILWYILHYDYKDKKIKDMKKIKEKKDIFYVIMIIYYYYY